MLLKKQARLFTLIALIMSRCVSFAYSMDNNILITGTLVTEPCTLVTGPDENIVDFENIASKDLYANTRIPGKAFSITLNDCDIDIGQSVNIMFSGHESQALPGLLSTDDDGSNGIAVGIETENGEAILLNKPSPFFTLSEGTTILPLRGYVTGDPKALENHSIKPGPFTATVTFQLSYH